MKSFPPALATRHAFTMQLTYPNNASKSAQIAATIGRHGGDLGTIHVVASRARRTTRGLYVRARNEQHVQEIVAAVRRLERVTVLEVTDPVFQMHLGGKICVHSKVPIASIEALAMAYTPGVARVSSAIALDQD